MSFNAFTDWMSSLVTQTALLPAGCQPWNLNMVASCGPNFVYCATLAVYNYEYNSEYGEYKLSSINASHSKTITCISWNRHQSSLYATAGSDEKIFVWDVKKGKCVASHEDIGFTPICIGWLPAKDEANVVAFCGKHGNIKLWNMKDNTNAQVDNTAGFDQEVTLFKWHHTDSSRFVLGHIDGSLSLFISGKRNKHVMKGHSDHGQKSLDVVLAALWDPLSNDYLLVARKTTGIQLIDVKAMLIINRFHLPSNMISTITMSWVESAPGMFVTGDHESGVLRLWSVCQSHCVENVALKSTGFQSLSVLHTIAKDLNKPSSGFALNAGNKNRSGSFSSLGSYLIPPAKVVCAFIDGGVGLYNLQFKKWEFFRDQGHIETIFDCKFKSNDPKVLATASFDGTIKIWSAIDLTPISTSSGNEGVIYSLSWAPGDQNCIACGTRRRGIFVWDIDKSKFVQRFTEHGKNAVYCVAWNPKDSQKLASCSDDATCVVRSLNNRDTQVFQHPDSTFGCDWNTFDKDMIATSCNDGVVRVWTTANSENKPLYNLKGHSSKIFNVRWHPLIENILCSGSDDKTIRIWAVKSETCTGVLHGHSSPVRGLCWNFELPFILASGSWDNSLKIWDTRKEKCLDTVLDHGADVYGMASHCNNPFILATSSRDSTLRLWSLHPMMHTLFLKVVAGVEIDSIIDTPDKVMQKNSSLKLAGKMSKQLVQQIHEKKNQDDVQLRRFSELFSTSRRIENLWDLVCVVRGQKESNLSAQYKQGIMHTKHLTKYKTAEVNQAERMSTHRSSISSQFRLRDQPLMRIAQLYMKLGNMQKHCELLVQLGHWEKALALAPSVSLAFWSKLATRYAEILRSDDVEDATNFYLAAGNVTEAVRYMSGRNEYYDALLTAQAAAEGNCPSMVQDQPTDEESKDIEGYNDLVTSCCNELAERSYNNADPYSAASFYLAYNDVTSAVNCLVKSNKLSLALCISHNLKQSFDSSIEAARMLARTCEIDDPFLAVRLLKKYDPHCVASADKWSSLCEVCAHCSNEKDKPELHKAAGLPDPEQCDLLADDAKKNQKLDVALKYYALGTTPQKALELGLQLLKHRLRSNANWCMDDIMSDLKAAFSIRESVLRQQSNKQLRTQLLTISAYFGVLYAYRRKYLMILKPMFEYVISMCELSRRFDNDFPLFPLDVQDEMRTVADAVMYDEESNVLERVIHRAGEEPLKCLVGSTIVNASDLPSHSESYTSTISKTKINGSVFMLEDGRSTLSYNEAVMWAKCNEFSPTSSGARICPF